MYETQTLRDFSYHLDILLRNAEQCQHLGIMVAMATSEYVHTRYLLENKVRKMYYQQQEYIPIITKLLFIYIFFNIKPFYEQYLPLAGDL